MNSSEIKRCMRSVENAISYVKTARSREEDSKTNLVNAKNNLKDALGGTPASNMNSSIESLIKQCDNAISSLDDNLLRLKNIYSQYETEYNESKNEVKVIFRG